METSRLRLLDLISSRPSTHLMVLDFPPRQNFVFSAAFKCSWESTASGTLPGGRNSWKHQTLQNSDLLLILLLPDETFYWILLDFPLNQHTLERLNAACEAVCLKVNSAAEMIP